MPLTESAALDIARRAVREIDPGAVVALDRGLPELVAQAAPESLGAWFLKDDGTLNGLPLSAADAAAIIRGGYVDLAIVQPAQVIADGSFVDGRHSRDGVVAPQGNGVDIAAGARRVIALHPQIDEDSDTISLGAAGSAWSLDGIGCVDIVIADSAVFQVRAEQFVMSEIAAGRSTDEVLGRVDTPDVVSVRSGLPEIETGAPTGSPASKVYADGPSSLSDVTDGATVFIDGFGGPGGMGPLSADLVCGTRGAGA